MSPYENAHGRSGHGYREMNLNNKFQHYYRPQTKFAKVMFYTCLSFCPRGGGWYPSKPCSSPGPHPGGRLRGLAGGSPGPHSGGPHPGGSPGLHPEGCIPAQTATAAGGTHPTGMHSCLRLIRVCLLVFQDSCCG